MFKPLFPLFLLLAALACGQPAATGGTQPGAAEEPRYGGRLNIRLSGDFTSFDTTAGAGRDPYIARHARNRLVNYKTGPELKWDEAVMIPELAERWEVSPDAKTFTFYLRKGVKWHDLAPVNGRELNSADVKSSVEYWGRLGQFADKKMRASRVTEPTEGLERIEAPDQYTVRMSYKEPFVPLVHQMSRAPMAILPRELLELEGGHPGARVIGTGPYWLDETAGQKGTRYVWRKHQSFWQEGRPYIDEVYQLLVPAEAAAQAAFKTGQVDLYTEDISLKQGDEFARSNPNAVRYEYPMNRTGSLIWNERPGYLFSDARLRKAMSLGIDRDEFNRTFFKGRGQWAMADGQPGLFTEEEVKKILRYDPTEAARLVRETGFPNGLDVETRFSTSDPEESVSAVQLAQAQLKKVGINLVLTPTQHTEFSNLRRDGRHQLFIFQSGNYSADLDSTLASRTSVKDPTNYSGMEVPAFNAIVQRQRAETDPAKRKDMVRDAIRYISENHHQGIALGIGVGVMFWQPYVKGYYPNGPADEGRTYMPKVEEVWLAK